MVKYSLRQIIEMQLINILPPQGELEQLESRTKAIIKILRENIRKLKIKADIFIGGSFAKNTLIKKDKYDVDIFIRFDSSYEEDKISLFLDKIVPANATRIHGSRDYFIIKDKENNFEFEIIPTLKIKNPSQAKNITDLSYFHVNYVTSKIKKDKKLANEIRIAKAFIHYADCYGAESYINGFSGYAVELLVIYYKSFVKFIEAMIKNNNSEKIILDPAKFFKDKKEIMKQINESKLLSPIILIDPTFRERNALAALSDSTFIKFKNYCSAFLKNPSDKFFIRADKEKIFRNKNKDIIELDLVTNRQAGDIAGTKLKKFSEFFIKQCSRFFNIKEYLFIYNEKENLGKILLVAEQKKEIIFSGPPIIMKEQLVRFKREHKKIEIRNKQAFAREKSMSFEEFLRFFKNKKADILESMGVVNIKKI